MRTILKATVGFVALVSAGSALAQDRVVNVYNWSDYIDPSVLTDFTKETGIKVVYDTMDANETLETKLLAGNTGYDVVVPSGTFLQRQIKAGIYQPIDKSKIPNLKNIWPVIAGRLATYDPGNTYAVNYMWGTTGIGYNVDAVKKRLGTDHIDSWEVVFKPDILAKFKDCGVMVLDSPEDLMTASLKYLKLDPNSKDTGDLQKATDLMLSIRPSIRKFESSEYINALANGDICLAVGYSGDVYQAKTRAADAHSKTPDKPLVDVGYAIPKEGAFMWFDSMAIPKDAPHVAEAYAFIDYMNRPDVAAKNSNYVSYANGNLASQGQIDPKVKNDPEIYPDDAMLAKLYTVSPYEARVQRTVTRDWTRIKTGQ